MFNPERLLAGLIRSGLRRNSGGGPGSLLSGAAALGLVGVAMEAADHFINRPRNAPSATGSPPPPPARGAAPSFSTGATPPPPPGHPVVVGPPPMPGVPTVTPSIATPETQRADAVVFIQAMIAAANADGVIDEQEKSIIVEKLQKLQLSDEEHRFIIDELLAPKPMNQIVSTVNSPDMARQVYMVSLLAIDVDTDPERQYLRKLARELDLNLSVVAQIHRQLGVALP